MANDRDELMRLADILRVNIEGPIGADEEEGDPGFICIGVDDAKLIENALRTLAQRHTEQCCTCGKRFDAREQSEGGTGEGAELTDGRWTCSAECWELATEQRAPQNGSVPEGWRRFVEECSQTAGREVCGNSLSARAKALLAAAPAPEARQPDGYAYRYEVGPGMTVIRMNGGREVNGAMPIEAIPYFYGTPAPEAERAKGEPPKLDIIYDANAGVYVATSKEAPGLVVEAQTVDELRREAAIAYAQLRKTAPPPAGQPEGVEGPSWSDYWQRQGRWDLSHDYEQYRRACEWMEARHLASAQRAGKDGA